MPGNTISTTTVTLTGTHTVTVQAAPVLLFGLPPELILIFTVAVVAVVFLFFRFQVKGVAVSLIWIYKNGTAVMMGAKEDLQGIFLDVLKGGRKVEILKKTGLALPVRYVPGKFKAYMDTPKDKTLAEVVGGPLLEQLRGAGFKLTPTKYDRKARVRGYLVEKERGTEKAIAYLDVSLGGMKQARLYASVEGTGETIDWMPRIAAANQNDASNTVILQEMKTAAKSFFALLAEAMQGSLKTFLLPLLAGLGLGGMITLLLFVLSGHLK